MIAADTRAALRPSRGCGRAAVVALALRRVAGANAGFELVDATVRRRG